MVRVLVFKKNYKTKELDNYKTKPKKNEIIWTHLQRKEDQYLDVLLDSFTNEEERKRTAQIRSDDGHCANADQRSIAVAGKRWLDLHRHHCRIVFGGGFFNP